MTRMTLTIDVPDMYAASLAEEFGTAATEAEGITLRIGGVTFPTEAVSINTAPPVWVAVVEWSSDSGQEPRAFLATTEAEAARRAHACVAKSQGTVEHDEAGEYVAEHPVPDLTDGPALAEWYAGWHEETCDGWVTVTSESVAGA